MVWISLRRTEEVASVVAGHVSATVLLHEAFEFPECVVSTVKAGDLVAMEIPPSQ